MAELFGAGMVAHWELASDGLKPPMDDMVEVFVSDPRLPDTVFAICSEGRLLIPTFAR